MLGLWDRVPSPGSVLPEDVEALRRLRAANPEALLVACAGEDVVGALIAAWDGWRGNMYRLAVDPAQRRRGVARALVAAGEERLRALGARRVAALVFHPNRPAAALWRSVGYAWEEEVDRYVRNM